MHLRPYLPALAILLLATLSLAQTPAQPLDTSLDDWEGNPLPWLPGEQTLTAHPVQGKGTLSSLLVHRHAAPQQELLLEATLTFSDPGQDVRKGDAGIAFGPDERTVCQLLLTQNDDGSSRAVALILSQDDDATSAQRPTRLSHYLAPQPWQDGVPYRLSLRQRGNLLSASVLAPDGQLVFRSVLRHDGPQPPPHLRPMLVTTNAACRFSKLSVAPYVHDEPPYEPPSTPPPAVPPVILARPSPDDEPPANPTGFFRLDQDSQRRFWLRDPDGRRFVACGVSTVNHDAYSWPARLLEDPSQRLQWESETLRRLADLGFNTLAYCDPSLLRRGLPHLTCLELSQPFLAMGDDHSLVSTQHRSKGVYLANVFHPAFRHWVRYAVRQRARTLDPWTIGLLPDLHIPWNGSRLWNDGLLDDVLQLPPSHSAKAALRDFLEESCEGQLDRLNREWGLRLDSFSDILTLSQLPDKTNRQRQRRAEFGALVARLYLTAVAEAVRAYAPHHLLVCPIRIPEDLSPARLALIREHADLLIVKIHPQADLAAKTIRCADSGNKQPLLADALDRLREQADMPVILWLWSFAAMDANLPNNKGWMQRLKTQSERAQAAELFIRTSLAHPIVVGHCYSNWTDGLQKALPPMFYTDVNVGLVNKNDEPYREYAEAFARVQADPVKLRLEPPPTPAADAPATAQPELPALYRDFLQTTPSADASPNPAFTIRQTAPNAFTVSNGLLTLQATPDSPGVAIIHRDRQLSTFTAQLQFSCQQGFDDWREITRLTQADIRADQHRLTVDLTGDFLPEPDSGRLPFVIRTRLVLPASADWLLMQMRSFANPADATGRLEVKAAFLRLYPDFDGKREGLFDYQGALARASLLGLTMGGYTSPDRKRFIGAATRKLPNVSIMHSQHKVRGDYFPDHSWRPASKASVFLKPGEAFTFPEQPFFFLVTGGDGDFFTMQSKLFRLWR
ncbi:MAG: hypothetical protein ACI4WT_06575 [Oligosphaeraceae bacterium]